MLRSTNNPIIDKLGASCDAFLERGQLISRINEFAEKHGFRGVEVANEIMHFGVVRPAGNGYFRMRRKL